MQVGPGPRRAGEPPRPAAHAPAGGCQGPCLPSRLFAEKRCPRARCRAYRSARDPPALHQSSGRGRSRAQPLGEAMKPRAPGRSPGPQGCGPGAAAEPKARPHRAPQPRLPPRHASRAWPRPHPAKLEGAGRGLQHRGQRRVVLTCRRSEGAARPAAGPGSGNGAAGAAPPNPCRSSCARGRVQEASALALGLLRAQAGGGHPSAAGTPAKARAPRSAPPAGQQVPPAGPLPFLPVPVKPSAASAPSPVSRHPLPTATCRS